MAGRTSDVELSGQEANGWVVPGSKEKRTTVSIRKIENSVEAQMKRVLKTHR